jgi:hypothetical protein
MPDTSPTSEEIFQAAILLDDLITAKQAPPLPRDIQQDPRLPALAIALRRFSGGELLKSQPHLFQLGPPPVQPLQRPTVAPTAVKKPKPAQVTPSPAKAPKAKANRNITLGHLSQKVLRQHDYTKLALDVLRRRKRKNWNQVPAAPRKKGEKRPGMGSRFGQQVYTDDIVQRNMRVLWADLFH